MLKWAGALGGAVVVGAAAGFGADMLVRPNVVTTKTVTTTTTTATTPAPPATISYKPPLSAEVQTRVDAIVADRKALHTGETIYYTANTSCNPVKFRFKNGAVTTIEHEDLINPNVAMEDKYISESAVTNGLIQWRTWDRDIALRGVINHPQRLMYPMKRISGARGDPNGKYVRITWDEAIATIASKMAEIKSKYGSYSIYNNPVGAWHECDTGSLWGCESTEAQDFALRFMLGAGKGVFCAAIGTGAVSITTALQSKLIVLWGWEAIASAGGGIGTQSGYYLRLAHEKGIPIICIDPRYTMAAEVCADQWIPINPGTDSAMLLAVAEVLFKENLYDAAYVNKFVEPTGFAKWKDYVLGVTAGPDGAIDRTPEWAEKICGVPAATIREFARLYAKSKPVFWSEGTQVGNKQPKAENNSRAMIALQSMTGNLGILGGTDGSGGWHGTPGMSYGRPVNTVILPAVNYGTKAATFVYPQSPSGVGMFMRWRLPDVINLREKYDQGVITKAQYHSLIGNKADNPTPNVKMAFTGEFINQNSEINKFYAALGKLEFVVGFHYHSKAPEVRIGDIILPVAMGRTYQSTAPPSASPIEEPSFTRVRNYMVYQPKLATLPGETRSRLWVWVQLAKLLGFSDKYFPLLADTTWDQWDAKLEGLYQTAYETWAANSDVKAAIGTPPTWADFKKKPYIAFPLNTSRTEFIPWDLNISGGQPFATASGKIEIYSDYLADTAKVTADYYGGPIDPMPIYSPCWTNYWTKDEFNKYPLWIFNPHGTHRRHDFYDANPMIGDVTNELTDPLHSGDVHGSTVTMSAVDAKLRGINDGDMVRVFNDAGQAVLKAIVMSSMSPGLVQLPEGRWADVNAAGIDRRGGTDMLTYNRPSPSCANPFNAPVQVEKF